MISKQERFRLRNESDIFNLSNTIFHMEKYRPQKKYNLSLRNIDHININQFINKPISKAKKFQKICSRHFSDSNNKSIEDNLNIKLNKNNSFKLNRNKSENNSFPKYKNELSPFQRKIIEIYGKEKMNLVKNNNIKNSKGEINRERKNSNKKLSLSQNLTLKKFENNNLIQNKENKKYNNQSSSKEIKMNSLESNIFFLPKKEDINLNIKKIPLTDGNKISDSKKKKMINYSEINEEFCWKDNSNEIKLKRLYNKTNNNLNVKERKIKQLNNSMDNINLLYKPINKNINNDKRNKIKRVKMFYKGRTNSLIQKQLNNISILSQDDFYENNLNCINDKNKKEIFHSYLINNIKYEDISEIKKLLIKNGIHIFDIKFTEFNFIENKTFNLSIKIRENINDKKYNENLKKASLDIKNNIKGISIQKNDFIKKDIKLVPNIPANLNWKNLNYNSFKNRLDNTNNPQISRAKGKINKKE